VLQVIILLKFHATLNSDQTKYFTIISTIAAVVQLVLGSFGIFALEDSSAMGCYLHPGQVSSGTWVYYKVSGNTFATLHILAIIIQTASINASLYKTPKKYGLFGDISAYRASSGED
jgi:hypothetical protein